MKKPFTLVEVLIAMSVLSVFLLGLMQFYASTETVLSSGVERTETFERARIAMDMMANDLTCIYYSQTDKDMKPFLPINGGSSFQVSTIRPEKLVSGAKTNIIGVKYELKGDSGSKDLGKLFYSADIKGDTFSVSDATFGKETELVDGVTKFEVKPYFDKDNTWCELPAYVVIRLELVDQRTMKRMKANPSVKFDDKKREFRRMVIIDRGQPKPEL